MCRLIGLTVVVLAVAGSRADEPAETITVSASATVFVKPDTARVHYSVAAGGESTADAAKDAASKQLAAVNDAIKALKFSDLATSAGAVSLSRTATRSGRGFGPAPPVNPGANPAPPPVTTTIYTATIPLTATFREKEPGKLLGSVDLFVKRVTELGGRVTHDSTDSDPFGPGSFSSRSRVSESPRIEWLVADDTAARKDAYRAAVRKAKANAEAISKEIGWETLKIVSVADGASQPRDASEAAPRPGAGEVAVTARVTLKCSR